MDTRDQATRKRSHSKPQSQKEGFAVPPRREAIELIQSLEKQNSSKNWISELVYDQLSGQEFKAWLRDVSAGYFRNYRLLDKVLSRYCTRKPKPDIQIALKIAIYQILFQTRTQPKNVVFETVEVIKQIGDAGGARFANAVLRSLMRDNLDLDKLDLLPDERWSVPRWVYERCIDAYGEKWTHEFLQSSSQRPMAFVRARSEEVFGLPGLELDGVQYGKEFGLKPTLVRAAYSIEQPKSIRELMSRYSTDFIVQDISNQVWVEEVTAHLKDRGIDKILDYCASPGGKSIGLAWNGIKVDAFEFNDSRRVVLNQNLTRTQMSDKVRILSYDPASPANPKGSYKAVAVDAPCSASGLMSRHPEVRQKLENFFGDLQNLNKIQLDLLQNTSRLIPSGGSLIYSVCSILPDEGALLIRKFLEREQFAIHSEKFIGPDLDPKGDAIYFAVLLKK